MPGALLARSGEWSTELGVPKIVIMAEKEGENIGLLYHVTAVCTELYVVSMYGIPLVASGMRI